MIEKDGEQRVIERSSNLQGVDNDDVVDPLLHLPHCQHHHVVNGQSGEPNG